MKKSERMLRECLKWRATYKPEEIKWVSCSVSVCLSDFDGRLENSAENGRQFWGEWRCLDSYRKLGAVNVKVQKVVFNCKAAFILIRALRL